MTIEHLCEETKSLMITRLIGLAEAQRKIYEKYQGQPEAKHKKLRDAYKLHQRELELLIEYQKERNR